MGREGRVILLLEEVECVARVFGGSGHGRRVAAQLQSLLDLRQPTVVMVATTVSPELVLPALRRPGRLGTELALRQPGREEREGDAEVPGRGGETGVHRAHR